MLCKVAPPTYCVFQSTPSAWRETVFNFGDYRVNEISIHSLRMEGDAHRGILNHKTIISIHSLRMEGDSPRCRFVFWFNLFQSTPSAWRETPHGADFVFWFNLFQSTPSAWRETFAPFTFHSQSGFQSTPSAWRETGCVLS